MKEEELQSGDLELTAWCWCSACWPSAPSPSWTWSGASSWLSPESHRKSVNILCGTEAFSYWNVAVDFTFLVVLGVFSSSELDFTPPFFLVANMSKNTDKWVKSAWVRLLFWKAALYVLLFTVFGRLVWSLATVLSTMAASSSLCWGGGGVPVINREELIDRRKKTTHLDAVHLWSLGFLHLCRDTVKVVRRFDSCITVHCPVRRRGLTAELQPHHLPDRHGQFDQSHVVAVVYVLQQVVDLLLHLNDSGIYWDTKQVFIFGFSWKFLLGLIFWGF